MADGGVVVIFEDVTEREQAEARAQFLATHDELTGLPNRLVFGQAVSDAVKAGRRYGQEFAVMFIDLDRFKIINDTLGHAAGDFLLTEIAKRLKQCVRESDVVARVGGDEFVILLREVSDADAGCDSGAKNPLHRGQAIDDLRPRVPGDGEHRHFTVPVRRTGRRIAY